MRFFKKSLGSSGIINTPDKKIMNHSQHCALPVFYRSLVTSGLIKDFGTSKSAKIESLPSAFILSGGTAPSQTASTKTTYSSTQPDSCMPLRRDNIALGRTCSRAFGTYAAPSFQPRLPCLLDLAPLSMSRSVCFSRFMWQAFNGVESIK